MANCDNCGQPLESETAECIHCSTELDLVNAPKPQTARPIKLYEIWIHRVIDILILVGPSYHLTMYAKANRGFESLWADLAKHSLGYDFLQMLIYAAVMLGPYLFIGLARIASKSPVSDLITLFGASCMVTFTFYFFVGNPASSGFQWAVVMLPVILYPFALLVLIFSLVFDTNIRNFKRRPSYPTVKRDALKRAP